MATEIVNCPAEDMIAIIKTLAELDIIDTIFSEGELPPAKAIRNLAEATRSDRFYVVDVRGKSKEVTENALTIYPLYQWGRSGIRYIDREKTYLSRAIERIGSSFEGHDPLVASGLEVTRRSVAPKFVYGEPGWALVAIREIFQWDIPLPPTDHYDYKLIVFGGPKK